MASIIKKMKRPKMLILVLLVAIHLLDPLRNGQKPASEPDQLRTVPSKTALTKNTFKVNWMNLMKHKNQSTLRNWTKAHFQMWLTSLNLEDN